MAHGDVTINDIRAELARHDMRVYELAARIRMHPRLLGRVLRGRVPLTCDLVARITTALNGQA